MDSKYLTMCIHFQKQTELLTQALKHIQSCKEIWNVLKQAGELEILQPDWTIYLYTGLGIDENPSCLAKDGGGVFFGKKEVWNLEERMKVHW